MEDLPWQFQVAFDHASMVLNWQENLPEDEMPPKWMWCFDEQLGKHFDSIRARRESGSGAVDNTSSWEETDMDEGADADSYRRQISIM